MIDLFKDISLKNKMIFIFGTLCILTGVFLVILSFDYETIDEDYVVKKPTTNITVSEKLEDGEVKVSRAIDYASKGVYKLTYKTNISGNSLKEGTDFIITDLYGEGFELIQDKFLINGQSINLKEDEESYEDIIISYKNNKLVITFPNEKVKENNKIEVYLKLVGRDKEEYEVSKEAYYSFTPSDNNKYYEKKGMQSYIIEGNSKIKIDKKQN